MKNKQLIKLAITTFITIVVVVGFVCYSNLSNNTNTSRINIPNNSIRIKMPL